MIQKLDEISIEIFNEHFNDVNIEQELKVIEEWIKDGHLLNK